MKRLLASFLDLRRKQSNEPAYSLRYRRSLVG
jgi:hypothetical protein